MSGRLQCVLAGADGGKATGDGVSSSGEAGAPWRAPPVSPAPTGAAAPSPGADANVERLRAAGHPCWLLAYMRDLTRTMHPRVKSMNIDAFPAFVGRAFTVNGPDIYLSALEGIPPGAVYVQGGCSESAAVFSPGWTHAYVAPRGGVAVVVDGGVYKSRECAGAAVPMFAAFATPAIAINRREGRCNEDVVCGGVTVGPGDIVMGDADGVVVIPRACEAELFAKLDAFVHCNGCFGKVGGHSAAQAAMWIRFHQNTTRHVYSFTTARARAYIYTHVHTYRVSLSLSPHPTLHQTIHPFNPSQACLSPRHRFSTGGSTGPRRRRASHAGAGAGGHVCPQVRQPRGLLARVRELVGTLAGGAYVRGY